MMFFNHGYLTNKGYFVGNKEFGNADLFVRTK